MSKNARKIVKTRRATKIIGKKKFIDLETQKKVEMDVIYIEERDANFKKLWIGHLLSAINEVGNKKMQLLAWMIDNVDSLNEIKKTVDEICQETKISKATVIETLKALEKKDVIKRKTGIITINPNAIFQGGTKERMNVLISYHNIPTEEEKQIKRGIEKQFKKEREEELEEIMDL